MWRYELYVPGKPNPAWYILNETLYQAGIVLTLGGPMMVGR